MYGNPFQAYENVSKTTMSGKEVEAAVLTKAAGKLRECQNNWEDGNHTERLGEALKFNQRIWSIFQGELTRDDNQLPKEILRNLIVLGAFLDRRILEAMASPSPDKLDIVIRINQNIAEGLRDSVAEN